MPDVRELLLDPKPELSQPRYEAILALGLDAVPALVAVLADRERHTSDDDAEAMASIHAARILGDLKAEAAIPALLAELLASEPGYILWDAALFALEAMGAAVIEPALALVPSATEQERSYLASALAQAGAHDPRIMDLLLGELKIRPEYGAMHLGHYASPETLPALLAAFDATPLEDDPGRFGNQVLVELQASIVDVGGVLNPAQQAKFAEAMAPREALRRRYSVVLDTEPADSSPGLGAPTPIVPQMPVRVAIRPGRNEPCHCGSGRKYKKCHLAQDGR